MSPPVGLSKRAGPARHSLAAGAGLNAGVLWQGSPLPSISKG
jgi:hypothetical protein